MVKKKSVGKWIVIHQFGDSVFETLKEAKIYARKKVLDGSKTIQIKKY